jgi:hypothetical protein
VLLLVSVRRAATENQLHMLADEENEAHNLGNQDPHARHEPIGITPHKK